MNAIHQKNPADVLRLQVDTSQNPPLIRLGPSGELDHRVRPLVRWAFYGFVATIPFETVDLGIPLETTMISLGILLITIFTQLSLVFRRPPAAFGFFIAYLLMCYFAFAINTPAYLYREAIWQLLVISQLIVMSWMAFNIMRSEQVARKALIIFALSCALLAVLQQLGISQSAEGRGGLDRVTALGFHPNNIARILGLGLLSIAGLVYAVKRPAFKSHIWVWGVIALLGLTIVQTGSRGGLLAVAAGLMVFGLKKGDVSTRLRNLAVIFVGFLLFVALIFQSEMSLTRFEKTLEDGNLARRDTVFPAAWQMITEKPIFGWGAKLGEFELGERLAHPRDISKNAHNLILYVLMSVGVVGFVPLMLGIFLALRAAWKARLGERGVLPLSLLLTVLAANMSGIWVNNKMHWLVTAYVLSSVYIGAGVRRIYIDGNQFTADKT